MPYGIFALHSFRISHSHFALCLLHFAFAGGRGGPPLQSVRRFLTSRYIKNRKKSSEWANLAKTLSFGSPEGVLSTSSG